MESGDRRGSFRAGDEEKMKRRGVVDLKEVAYTSGDNKSLTMRRHR